MLPDRSIHYCIYSRCAVMSGARLEACLIQGKQCFSWYHVKLAPHQWLTKNKGSDVFDYLKALFGFQNDSVHNQQVRCCLLNNVHGPYI